MALEYLQRWRPHNLWEICVNSWSNSQYKCFSLCPYVKAPAFQFMPFVSGSVTKHHRRDCLSSLQLPFRSLYFVEVPRRLFSPRLNSPSSLNLSLCGRFSCPLIILMALCWNLSCGSLPLLYWGAQNWTPHTGVFYQC